MPELEGKPRVLIACCNGTGWIHKLVFFEVMKMLGDPRVEATFIAPTWTPFVQNLHKTTAETDAIYIDRGGLDPQFVAANRWTEEGWQAELPSVDALRAPVTRWVEKVCTRQIWPSQKAAIRALVLMGASPRDSKVAARAAYAKGKQQRATARV